MKGGNFVWTCAEDNIVDKKEDNKEIVLHEFDYTLFEEKEYGVELRGILWVSIFESYNLVVAWGLGGAFGYNE